LVAHPKLPILFMGSDDGRFFIFAFKIDYVQPPAAEDDEFSGDDETQDDQVIKFSGLRNTVEAA